jgi:hypothetical protein
MTDHFNQLTPAEDERLAKLCEEAAEVVQIGMKIMRHGYESYNPDKPEDGSNREQLCRELEDLYKIATYMFVKADIGIYGLPQQIQTKFNHMHHQDKEKNE